MELIDNINRLLGDDLEQALKAGACLKVAASCKLLSPGTEVKCI